MKIALIVGVLAFSAAVSAKDMGVQGNAWPIIELDVRQMMVESAAKTDWTKAQDAVKESAREYIDRLPKRQLPISEKTVTAWMDPSVEMPQDIQAPIEQPNGMLAWQVIIPKGTRVNPLHQFRPVTAMFFFDGADERQFKLVQEVFSKEKERITFVESGAGSLKVSSEALGVPVFHANDALISRFQVKYLPSMVYPGTGKHSDYLGVTSYGLPFNAIEVLKTWADLGYTAEAPSKPLKDAKK